MRVLFSFLGFIVLGCGGADGSAGVVEGTGGEASVAGSGGQASTGGSVATGGQNATGGSVASTGGVATGSGGAPSLRCTTDADCAAGWLCVALTDYAGADHTPMCRKPCIEGTTPNRSPDCANESDDFCSAVVMGRFVNNCEGRGAPRACAGTIGPDPLGCAGR